MGYLQPFPGLLRAPPRPARRVSAAPGARGRAARCSVAPPLSGSWPSYTGLLLSLEVEY